MKYLITGGTGTLGQALTREILKVEPAKNITIYSRGEQKQVKMRSEFPGCQYIIGDVRDRNRLHFAIQKSETVIHCAALKHVDLCESETTECCRTNIDGTINVAELAEECGSRYCVLSSTDKAVLPINHYGYTKAAAEKIFFSHGKSDTKFVVFRWGNVVGSNGSCIRTFYNQLKRGDPITLTDSRMTRFWIRISDAAKFLLENYLIASSDQAVIPPMRAAHVHRIIDAIAVVMGVKKYVIKTVGIRPGEKLHECLLTSHEYCLRSDTHDQYSDEELQNMVREVVCGF